MRFARGSETLSASQVDATVGILKIIGVARVLELLDYIISVTIVQPGPSDRTKAGIYGYCGAAGRSGQKLIDENDD